MALWPLWHMDALYPFHGHHGILQRFSACIVALSVCSAAPRNNATEYKARRTSGNTRPSEPGHALCAESAVQQHSRMRLSGPAWPLGPCGYELEAADQIIVRLFGLEVTEPRTIRQTRRTGNWLVCYYHNTHVSVLPWARAEQVGVAE